MSLLSKGIAHVSFKGGGVCLPVRSPNDRQVLVDEVVTQARAKGMVQVLLDDDRWLVHGADDFMNSKCVDCGRRATPMCESDSHAGAFCLNCAVGKDGEQATPNPLETMPLGS